VSAPLIPSAPADLELIAQLKSKLQYAELRIRVLEERLRLLWIEKYGAGGEKLSQAQMQLFALEPVVSEVVEYAENEHVPVHRSTKKSAAVPEEYERRLRRSSRSWKAAVGCKSRCAIIFRRFSPGLPISRSGAFQT